MQDGGENSYMEPEARGYILHRFKTMSYFSSCLPYEYAPHLIRSDMEKAGFLIIPSDHEIEEVLEDAKGMSRSRILSMLRAGRSLSEIREWCEYSLNCPIPIPSVSQVRMNDLLSRFDYFNYELNRIVREERIRMAIEERRSKGVLFDPARVVFEYDEAGIANLADEFTRVDPSDHDEIMEMIRDAESNSDEILVALMFENLKRDTLVERASENHDVIYSRDELPLVLEDLIRRERFSIIAHEVARMGNSEIWNLINTVEAYKMWKLSRNFEANPYDDRSPDNQMLEMLKIYEQSSDTLREGYLFQVSKLSTSDLSHLVRLSQGYISWRSTFHYLQSGTTALNGSDLSRLITDGFSQEHGMEPSIFRMFLLSRN